MSAIDGTTGTTPVVAQPQSTAPPPSADLDGNGSLDPYEQQQAAVAFAPVLYFAPDEENFPADPMTFIEQSSLREEVDFWGDNELHGEGEVPPEELTDIGPDNADADSQ